MTSYATQDAVADGLLRYTKIGVPEWLGYVRTPPGYISAKRAYLDELWLNVNDAADFIAHGGAPSGAEMNRIVAIAGGFMAQRPRLTPIWYLTEDTAACLVDTPLPDMSTNDIPWPVPRYSIVLPPERYGMFRCVHVLVADNKTVLIRALGPDKNGTAKRIGATLDVGSDVSQREDKDDPMVRLAIGAALYLSTARSSASSKTPSVRPWRAPPKRCASSRPRGWSTLRRVRPRRRWMAAVRTHHHGRIGCSSVSAKAACRRGLHGGGIASSAPKGDGGNRASTFPLARATRRGGSGHGCAAPPLLAPCPAPCDKRSQWVWAMGLEHVTRHHAHTPSHPTPAHAHSHHVRRARATALHAVHPPDQHRHRATSPCVA